MYKSYTDYLRSDTWRQKRVECISLYGDRCIVCGAGYIEIAHLKYTTWGQENPQTDLIPICHTHHELLDKMLKSFILKKEKKSKVACHLIEILRIMEGRDVDNSVVISQELSYN